MYTQVIKWWSNDILLKIPSGKKKNIDCHDPEMLEQFWTRYPRIEVKDNVRIIHWEWSIKV